MVLRNIQIMQFVIRFVVMVAIGFFIYPAGGEHYVGIIEGSFLGVAHKMLTPAHWVMSVF